MIKLTVSTVGAKTVAVYGITISAELLGAPLLGKPGTPSVPLLGPSSGVPLLGWCLELVPTEIGVQCLAAETLHAHPAAVTHLRRHASTPSRTSAVTHLRRHAPLPSRTSAVTHLSRHTPPLSHTSAKSRLLYRGWLSKVCLRLRRLHTVCHMALRLWGADKFPAPRLARSRQTTASRISRAEPESDWQVADVKLLERKWQHTTQLTLRQSHPLSVVGKAELMEELWLPLCLPRVMSTLSWSWSSQVLPACAGFSDRGGAVELPLSAGREQV